MRKEYFLENLREIDIFAEIEETKRKKKNLFRENKIHAESLKYKYF